MSQRTSALLGGLLVVSAVCVTPALLAAPTTPPTSPPPPPHPTGGTPPAPTHLPGVQKPNPIHWYKFNGDLKDSVVPGLNLNPYIENAGPRWEPGKDGSKQGSIRGFGWADAKNAFVWPSFTAEYLVWPQSWNGKATGGASMCRSANVFANAYKVPTNFPNVSALSNMQIRNVISITGCPDDASDKGAVQISWDLDAPSVPPQQRTAIIKQPLRSNMWHEISVVFDGTQRKITLIIDGTVASTTAVPGPFHVGDVAANRIFMGVEAENGFEPFILDDFKFYASAVYPGSQLPSAVTTGAAQQRSLAH